MTCDSDVYLIEHAATQFCDVSVVIPCYCCAATLQRAVASVAAQTALPREVILVDDDSNDGSKTSAAIERIRAAYSSIFEVRSYLQIPNQGPGTSRNLGWNLARSQFVAFLDADDTWDTRKLEIQTSWMITHPSTVLTCHGCEDPRVSADVWGPRPSNQVRARELWVRGLIWRNPVSTPTVMVRRICEERFVDGSRFGEDFDLWLRVIGSGGKCSMIEDCLARLCKLSFGSYGQSGHLWAMESGELRAIDGVLRRHQLRAVLVRFAQVFSLLKFLRRAVIAGLYRMRLRARHKGRLQ